MRGSEEQGLLTACAKTTTFVAESPTKDPSNIQAQKEVGCVQEAIQS
jgi:hypothetical protein